MQKDKLQTLAIEKNKPCVTISMNTHRTHPDIINAWQNSAAAGRWMETGIDGRLRMIN